MQDGAVTWLEIVEHHHSCLIDELSTRLDSDLRTAVANAVAAERSLVDGRLTLARGEARSAQAELLNQALRRLRKANGEENILQVLSESCAACAEHTVVLVFENNQARCVASHGVETGPLAFDIAASPALLSAIESQDPLTVLVTEAELPAALIKKLQPAPERHSGAKAYLFPVNARHSVVAMLVASGNTPMVSATVELLCEAAGMLLETLAPESRETVPASATAERLSWDALSSEDQKLHLQAQRTARVRVAEMRLYNEQKLRNGVESSDIYTALQTVIDAARHQFLQTFLAKSPTMVDYLHLEILRTLAHDDDRLLGQNYPGPMV
jgi:hypothetical protein